MKKMISILLMLMIVFTSAGCDIDKTKEDPEVSKEPVIKSAVDFYTKVWDAFGTDNQFEAAGGDAEHAAEGSAKFALTKENEESFKYLLLVTDELYDMLDDDAATLQHMLNTNSFCSAVAKLKDPCKADEFAEAYKAAIQDQVWMCGFPDKVVVISVDNYVVMAYGLEDFIDPLIDACSAVASYATVLVDAPAMVD